MGAVYDGCDDLFEEVRVREAVSFLDCGHE